MGKHSKAIMAVFTTIISAILVLMIGGHHPTPAEWVNVAIAGVGACAVFAAPNISGARYTKTVIAVLIAVLTFLHTIIGSCAYFAGCTIPMVDWLQMAVIVMNTLGVYAVQNEPGTVSS